MGLAKIEISIITCIYNEAANIERFLIGINNFVAQIETGTIKELIIVDDGSTDGSLEIIERFTENNIELPIKLIKRDTKLGLVNAQLNGMKYSLSDSILFMDGDLQHPVEKIRDLIETFDSGFDLVIASRHVKGGGNNWSPLRGIISRSAIILSKLLLKKSRKVKDPLSGFFVIKKKYLLNLEPHPNFQKLLLYSLVLNEIKRLKEIPFVIIDREIGKSKIVDKHFNFIIKYVVEILTYKKLDVKSKRRERVPVFENFTD